MAKSIHSRPYKAFKQLLRDVRLEQGTTQAELADRLDFTQSRVSKIELGERRLDLIELRAWCVALGITLEEFVERFERVLRAKSLR